MCWRRRAFPLGLVTALAGAALGAVPLVDPAGAASLGGVPEGGVVAVGDAPPLFATAPENPVGLARTPSGGGWWAAGADGSVSRAGDAGAFGDLLGVPGRRPTVGLAARPNGQGYWLAGTDGGVFTFGDAGFHGSAGALPLVQPIVGMASTPSGSGYWLVAADGGVFTYGDAPFFGSTGGVRLVAPVVGMTPTPSGNGYWLVARDGGVFTFGDAGFHGVGQPGTTSIVSSKSGGGYWLGLAGGEVLARGDAPALAVPVLAGSAAALARSDAGSGLWVAVGPARERIVVSEPGGLSPEAAAWARNGAVAADVATTVWHRGNIDLMAVHRGGPAVWAAPPGWRVPASGLAVEPEPSRTLVGNRVTDALHRGEVALGAATARLRGAAVGDDVVLLGWDERLHARRVGAIADDDRTGSAEVIMSVADAAAMGFSRPASIVLWGAPRDALDRAMGSAGPAPRAVDVRRSWDLDRLDDVLPLVRLKELLGEMAYRPGRGDAVTLHPSFTSGIGSQWVPILGRVTCHGLISFPLRGALDEVNRAGLGGTLGRFGGCYLPRLVRGGDSGGNLSRHSFGIAVDLNITNNVFGGRVSMHPAVVDIFRRWGFAWGGTWTRPDGMHFEWVGNG
jgi:hypothetical protein